MRCSHQFVFSGRGVGRVQRANGICPAVGAFDAVDTPPGPCSWSAVLKRLRNGLARSAGSLSLVLVLVAVVNAGFPVTATADTLDRITNIERDRNRVTVGIEQLRVTAESRLSEATAEQPVVITFQSLSIGDYVVIERDGGVIKSLQRVDPASIDMPAAIPLPVRPGSDQ